MHLGSGYYLAQRSYAFDLFIVDQIKRLLQVRSMESRLPGEMEGGEIVGARNSKRSKMEEAEFPGLTYRNEGDGVTFARLGYR